MAEPLGLLLLFAQRIEFEYPVPERPSQGQHLLPCDPCTWILDIWKEDTQPPPSPEQEG